MRLTEAYIPPNANENGGQLGGIVSTRNAIETVIAVAMVVVICVFPLRFFPMLVRVIIGFVLALLMGGICFVGVGGEPVSTFLLSFVTYNRTKCFVTLRMPMPKEEKSEKKKLWKRGEKKKGEEKSTTHV